MSEWEAYYRIEPWGLENRNAAMLAALVVNALRGADQEPVQIEEFMPKFADEPKPDDKRELLIRRAKSLMRKKRG